MPPDCADNVEVSQQILRQTAHDWLRRKRITYFHLFPIVSALCTAVVILGSTWIIEQVVNGQYQQKKRLGAASQVKTIEAKLGISLGKYLHPLWELAGYIQAKPSLSQIEFEEIASRMKAKQAGIHSILLAKDTKISHVYPLSARANLLVSDVLPDRDLDRSGFIPRVIENKSIALADSFDAVTGKKELLAYLPVFLNQGGVDRYWGMVIARIDFKAILAESELGVRSQPNSIEYALRGKNIAGIEGSVLWGNSRVFQLDPEVAEVTLAGVGSWEIAAVPPDGWGGTTSVNLWLWLGGSSLAGVMGFLVWLSTSNPHRSRRLIDQATLSLRQTKDRLQIQQQTLVKLAKHRALNDGNLSEALHLITQNCAVSIGADRVSVWFYDDTHSKIICADLYEAFSKTHSHGQELKAVDYPSYFQALEDNRSIAVHIAETDIRTREFHSNYLKPLGIASMLDAPIRRGDQVLGVVCIEHIGLPRQWTVEEESFTSSISDMVAMSIERGEHKQAEEMIRYQAFHDTLTGLPNRQLFNQRLDLALEQAQSNHGLLAVLFIDLDRFKTINDSLGHSFGDRLLQDITERMNRCIDSSHTLARWGGDEFTLLMPQIQSTQDAVNQAHKVITACSLPFLLDGYELHVTTSIGIACFPQHGGEPLSLLKNADTAMYRAKENKQRNSCQLYTTGMNDTALANLMLVNHLRRAVSREELLVYYQPQLELGSGKIIGMEALVRWQHPSLGMINPAQFIPLAEEHGQIAAIGEWVLQTACQQNHSWQVAGFPAMTIAVNFSALQFQRYDLEESIKWALHDSNLAPEFLEIEITETAVMQDIETAVAVLNRLKQMGVKISIDDFGTGYSSLSQLKRLPIDQLKIDGSFVREILTNPQDAAITSTIIALAHSLGLKTVAEAVENHGQESLLRSLKCDAIQGYYFSRPLSAADATNLIWQHQNRPMQPNSGWQIL